MEDKIMTHKEKIDKAVHALSDAIYDSILKDFEKVKESFELLSTKKTALDFVCKYSGESFKEGDECYYTDSTNSINHIFKGKIKSEDSGTVIAFFHTREGAEAWQAKNVMGDFLEQKAKLPKELIDVNNEFYYIRNEGYLGNALIWWAKDGKGYTCDINNAHKYTKEQAENICKRPQDSAYRCSYIDGLVDAKKLIIDCQYVDEKERQWNN